MKNKLQLDFSNRKNRNIRLEDMSPDYLDYIKMTTEEDPWYPKYHIAPHHGLLNDPNGLCQINGVYHIFYQWYPAGPVHGLKYWYHLTTENFIEYKDYGPKIIPNSSFDYDGCYTGMILKDGHRARIYYTGVRGEEKTPSVCYAEFEQNEVLNKKLLIDYNPILTTLNFRDPCVIKKDNEYIMLVGAENNDNQGIITLFKSSTPYDFTYVGNLKLNYNDLGYMLECPNYYEQDNKGVLIFSPQGIKSPNKYDLRNVFSVIYSIGSTINVKTLEFDAPTYYEMDKGFDFYAPQIFKDEKNRIILYGWLGNSKCEYPSDKNNWAHMLTIPRRIEIESDRLIQYPLEELKHLRHKGIIVKDRYEIKDCSFEYCFEATECFKVEIRNEKGHSISFSCDGEEYQLDRTNMTYLYNEQYGTIRYAKRIENLNHEIRLFVDCSSIEIFCDNGKTVFTSRFFIDDVNEMRVSGIKGTLYQLKSNQY